MITLDNNSESPNLTIYPSAKVWTKWNVPTFIKLNHWMYDHPTARKVAKVASFALGAAVIAAAAFVPPIAACIGLAIGGAAIIGITYLAARIIDCLVSKRHDMKNLAFHPDKLEMQGKTVGELYYDGEVPVLKINTADSHEAGYAQGYLLQKELSELRSNVELCAFTLAGQKRPSEITHVLDLMKSKIPQKFLHELEGIVEGYNEKKGRFEKSLTFNDLLYMQLMPDAMYFHPENFSVKEEKQKDKAQTPVQAVACTLLGIPDQENAPLIARTMDWQSFGIAGKYSLIVSRFNETTGTRTAEVGMPGLIGTLTGVNNKGVSVAMNVTGYTGKVNSVEGLPAGIFNRLILEECASFDEAETFVQSNSSLGPYHLTVSDSAKSGTFSLYQKEDWSHNWSRDRKFGYRLRMMNGKQEPLITTNCSCTPYRYDMFNGIFRESLIAKYLTKNEQIDDPKNLLKYSQSIPWVNNQLTTHRVLMGHKTLEVAFDNAWAGDRDLHTVNLDELFA